MTTPPDWRAIDDTNPLIEFEPAANWQAFTGVDPAAAGWVDIWEKSYHSTTQTNSTFFIQFHGDGIDFWSHLATGNDGQFIMQLDGGELETVTLDESEPNPRLPIWQKAGLTLDDHDVIGTFVSNGSGGVGYLDSFTVHNTLYATDGFDLRSAGPAALDVPFNATVVDDGDPTVVFSGKWIRSLSVEFYQHASAYTLTPGDSFTFQFTGTAIWYYANLYALHAPVSISIDGGVADIANSTGTTGLRVSRRLIWSKQGLDNKLHTLTATHVGKRGQAISVDFFRVLAGNVVAASGDGGQQNPSNNNNSISVGVIAGSVIGAAALVIFTSTFLLWYRRTSQRRQMSPVFPNAPDPVKPYTTMRLESLISSKRERSLVSQTRQISPLAARDLETRAGGLEAASGDRIWVPLRDDSSPRQTTLSIIASRIGPEQEPSRSQSPAPPPPPYQP